MSSNFAYRADIDGLRAVAVISVVLFHASAAMLPGGFVGVDVFFVISGYLISKIILGDLQARDFSFVDFYRRRILRIFPALIVVLLASWGIGWTVLLADEYRELGKHIAAGAGFVSNFALWQESGYFDKAAETKPLLHLWSLGIEEQFYLLWPLLLAFSWRCRRHLPWLLGTLLLVSFAANLLLVQRHAAAAFYMPFSRFWELMFGAGIAYVELFHREEFADRVRRGIFALSGRLTAERLRDVVSVSGLLLVGLAIGLLGKAAVYPGVWALLPTLGAACLIAAGSQGWVNRKLLAHRWMVRIGLISYPLYLWHWPLLTYARIVESGKPPSKVRVAAVLLSVLLAYLTYRYIEKPVRFGRWPRRTPIAAILMACLLAGGLFVYLSHEHTSRIPEFLVKTEMTIPSPRHDAACKKIYPVLGAYCLEYPQGRPVTTAIIGDSHANHFVPGVAEALKEEGEAVVHLGEPGCPPLLGGIRTVAGTAENCTGISGSVIQFVANSKKIKRVIISFRGPMNVSGKGFGEIERHIKVDFSDMNDPGLSQSKAIEASLARTIEYLLGYDKEVWLIIQVPELGFHIDECTVRPLSITHRKKTPCAVPVSDVAARQAAYRAIVTRLQERFARLKVFDPLPYMCDERLCHGIVDGKVLYVDGDHLSQAGSLLLAKQFRFFGNVSFGGNARE